MSQLAKEYQAAIALLHELRTPNGFLASTLAEDNYKRIWARDSMVCGLAALLLEDEELISGLKDSLLTLAEHQHELGMVPSNVDPHTGDVSYGSLVGRIDSNSWFNIGACLYYLKTGDNDTWQKLRPSVLKNREYLKHLEFNNKGWLYTPLSGNWADEYPVHGFTLYDNCLRIWSERLIDQIEEITVLDIDQKTQNNFWPTADGLESAYHKGGYKAALDAGVSNYAAFLLPGNYDLRFDAAGNALGMLLWPLEDFQKQAIKEKVGSFSKDLGGAFIPAFWPIITEHSYDWPLLKQNYSFSFKNNPGDFHNGGVWPVWMGLFALGLAANDMSEEVEQIVATFQGGIAPKDNWSFQEYLNPLSKELGGKSQMGYSASGVIFMLAARVLKSEALRAFLHL